MCCVYYNWVMNWNNHATFVVSKQMILFCNITEFYNDDDDNDNDDNNKWHSYSANSV